MSNTSNLIFSKFCLDVTFTKSEADNKSWIWLAVEEIVSEKEIVKNTCQ